MNIVGISGYYHDAAACLLKDGKLVAAAEEERFSRVKHDGRLPSAAFLYCLREAGLGIRDIDCVAYYELPERKVSRQLWAGRRPRGGTPIGWLDGQRPEREIRELLGFEGRIEKFSHHASHAASAFFYSGFREAAVLTVDAVGEWATTSFGHGAGASLDLLQEVDFPHSLGLFYSALTAFLGFEVNEGEYKVMGLAPYGTPRLVETVSRLVRVQGDGGYELDLSYFDFLRGDKLYTPALSDLLGGAPREEGAELTSFHHDVAYATQAVLERALLVLVRALHGRVSTDALCLAGGVALNCVANRRLRREGPFRRMFVQPAAGDAGGALGAAALAQARLAGELHGNEPLEHVYLGPRVDPREAELYFRALGVPAKNFGGDTVSLVDRTVDLLEQGKVIGWVQGRMELGPRALGARSILADPRVPDMRDRVNELVKQRESFRPFAPSVLASAAHEHTDLGHPSPFMLETCQVTSPIALPAITHVDGSARPQTVDERHNPRYHALLSRFAQRTGCPVLLNTSFNQRGEPIVCSASDALGCMVRARLDALVIEDFLIEREALPARVVRFLEGSGPRARDRAAHQQRYIYAFV